MELRDLMLDRDQWNKVVESALANIANDRSPDAVLARIQKRSTKPPHKDLKTWSALSKSGRSTRFREFSKAIGARRCTVCEEPNCVTHCLVCNQTHPPSPTTPLLTCQLCSMPCATSCLPRSAASDAMRIIDSITPALAETIFLCNDCYVICRHYPMPPEIRCP